MTRLRIDRDRGEIVRFLTSNNRVAVDSDPDMGLKLPHLETEPRAIMKNRVNAARAEHALDGQSLLNAHCTPR
jgi:hypothetical protein